MMTVGERCKAMAEAGAPDDLIADVLGLEAEELVRVHKSDLAAGRYAAGEHMYRLLMAAAEEDSRDAVKIALAWMQGQWWAKKKPKAESVTDRVPVVDPNQALWRKAG